MPLHRSGKDSLINTHLTVFTCMKEQPSSRAFLYASPKSCLPIPWWQKTTNRYFLQRTNNRVEQLQIGSLQSFFYLHRNWNSNQSTRFLRVTYRCPIPKITANAINKKCNMVIPLSKNMPVGIEASVICFQYSFFLKYNPQINQ